MRLAYNVYTSVAQQLQVAEAKVQEITPVYTIVEPATIPIRAAKPNKAMVLIGIVLFSGSRLCRLDTLRKKDLPGFEKMTL